jgi:hypothetical protein
MRYVEFNYLIEGYPQAQAAFIQDGADTASVQKTIADFKQLVTRNQVNDVNQKNIDWWVTQGWEKFNAFVNQAIAVPSKTQVTRKKIEGQSIKLIDNTKWLILIPIDKDASCFHGKDSSWCTTKIHQQHFEKYFYETEVTLIYCFNKKTGGMWAVAISKLPDLPSEFFDQQDTPMTPAKFEKQTGLDFVKLRTMAMGETHQPVIQASRDKWRASVDLTKKLLDKLPRRTRSAEIEKQLMFNKYGRACYEYMRKVASVDSKSFPLAIQIAAFSARTEFDMLDLSDDDVENNNTPLDNDDDFYDPIMMTPLRYIKNPVDDVLLVAIKKDRNGINNIIDLGIKPSERIQIAAVTQYGTAASILPIIRSGITPSEAVQLAAINNNVEAFRYIMLSEIPTTETVQLTAVEKWPAALAYIKNPSMKVQQAALKAEIAERERIEAKYRADKEAGRR